MANSVGDINLYSPSKRIPDIEPICKLFFRASVGHALFAAIGGECRLDRNFMPPKQAAELKRLALLKRTAKQITSSGFLLFDTMLWHVRRHGFDRVRVSFAELEELTGLCRDSLARLVPQLEDAGLLQRIKDWVWMKVDGIWQKRQAVNLYIFARPPESDFQTVPFLKKESLSKYGPVDNGENGENGDKSHRRRRSRANKEALK
jgi:hypothetical protein